MPTGEQRSVFPVHPSGADHDARAGHEQAGQQLAYKVRVSSVPRQAVRHFSMRPVQLARAVGLASVLLAGLAAAEAATVYRWTDDEGRTHYSEVVPEKYRKTARPVASGDSGPTPDQQREAQERAAREKARAADIRSDAPKAPLGAPSAPASSPPAARRPDRVPDERTDCETWARLYKESIDCFAPFRTASGATREEAFAYCTPVSEPPTWCRKRVP